MTRMKLVTAAALMAAILPLAAASPSLAAGRVRVSAPHRAETLLAPPVQP